MLKGTDEYLNYIKFLHSRLTGEDIAFLRESTRSVDEAVKKHAVVCRESINLIESVDSLFSACTSAETHTIVAAKLLQALTSVTTSVIKAHIPQDFRNRCVHSCHENMGLEIMIMRPGEP